MRRHRVLLVEDEAHARARLARAVEAHPRLELVGSVGSCAEARRALECRPDVLLTDLKLPDGSGLDLIRELRAGGAKTLSMIITVFGDEPNVVAAIEAGAMGYLLKDAAADSVGDAIQELVAGGSPLSPAIARHVLKRFQGPEAPAETDPDAPRLSQREREILVRIVRGFSYKEIAGQLEVSTHTVATHVRSIYRKLSVHSRSEAVYEALQLGLVKLED
jgi:DNA-binding NarL/FixJ family response regulator